MDSTITNWILSPRSPLLSLQFPSQISPLSSIQRPKLEDQFIVDTLQILRPGELLFNRTFSPIQEAPVNHLQPQQPVNEGQMPPCSLMCQIPPEAPTQMPPTFAPPFVTPSQDFTTNMRKEQWERMWEMHARLHPPHTHRHASPDFISDMIRPTTHDRSSLQAQNRRELENYSPTRTFSPLDTSASVQPRRLQLPTTIPPSSSNISHFRSFPQTNLLGRSPSAVSSRFIPCSWEAISPSKPCRPQGVQSHHRHRRVQLLPNRNPVSSSRLHLPLQVCSRSEMEGPLEVPRTHSWPPAHQVGYCSEPFGNSRRTSRRYPENQKMSRITEDEESDEDLEPIDEIDSESSLRNHTSHVNDLGLPDVVLEALNAAANIDETIETQET